MTRNLVGSIRVTYRSNIAKIVLIGNRRWPRRLENLFFASSSEPKGQLTRNLVGSFGVTDLWIKNSQTYSDRKSKMASIAAILKIYFSLLHLNHDAN